MQFAYYLDHFQPYIRGYLLLLLYFEFNPAVSIKFGTELRRYWSISYVSNYYKKRDIIRSSPPKIEYYLLSFHSNLTYFCYPKVKVLGEEYEIILSRENLK